MRRYLLLYLFILLVFTGYSFMVQPLSQSIEVDPGDQKTIELIISSTTPNQETINVTASGLYSTNIDNDCTNNQNDRERY